MFKYNRTPVAVQGSLIKVDTPRSKETGILGSRTRR
jgi:hypothetical protein